MIEIVPGKVYQCMLLEAQDILDDPDRVLALGIRSVLTVAHDAHVDVPRHLIHVRLPVDEIHETDDYLFEFACRVPHPVLVHCVAGAARSPVFAALIAHRVYKLDLEEAVARAEAMNGIVYRSMMKWASKRMLE